MEDHNNVFHGSMRREEFINAIEATTNHTDTHLNTMSNKELMNTTNTSATGQIIIHTSELENVSTEASEIYDMPSTKWFLFCLTFFFAVFIISVNALTIIVVRRTSTLRTLSNMYITSLAFVDLMVGVGLFPIACFHITYIRVEFFDSHIRFCVFMNSFSTSTMCMSILHLAVISIDRCVSIKAPYFYRKQVNGTRTFRVIIGIWSFGVIYTCLPQLRVIGQSVVCDTTKVMPMEFIAYSNPAVYFTAVVVAMVMYSIILHTATKRHRRSMVLRGCTYISRPDVAVMAQATNQLNKEERKPRHSDDKLQGTDGRAYPSSRRIFSVGIATDETQNTDGLGESRKDSASQSTPSIVNEGVYRQTTDRARALCQAVSHNKHEQALKNIKFFMIVYGVFVLCMTPAALCSTIDYFIKVENWLYNTSILLGLANSGANFFIFYSINSAFRNCVRKTLHCA